MYISKMTMVIWGDDDEREGQEEQTMEQGGLSNTETAYTFIIYGLYACSVAKHFRFNNHLLHHVQLLPLRNKCKAPVAMPTCR